MRNGLLAAVFGAAALGCVGEPPTSDDVGDWGDPDRYPELGGAYASLTALNGTCTFTTAGTMTINGNDAAQTIIIGRRAIDSAILVNGATCGSPAATSTSLKILNINQAMGGDQVVIIDYINGLFATGTSVARGINVDLGAGTDSLRFRGTSAVDTFTFGSAGISVNIDANRDLDHTNVESFNVSLAGGNDVFSGAGNANGAGAMGFGTAVTVYGGDGNDAITATAHDDTVYGGAGDDTVTGGLGDDSLYGDAGNDTFNEGSVDSGDDTFDGGANTDTVSYANRMGAVTVTVGVATMGNEDGEAGEEDDVQATIEVVTGGAGNDDFTGDANANTFNGGAGDDTLTGAGGADVLNGGDGADTFDEGSTSNGGDTFNGGAGIDTVDYSARTNDLTVTMDGMAANDGEMAENDRVQADVENLVGGDGNDNVTGNALANILTGGAGTDVLSGAAGNDSFAEADDDTGGDTFNGGDGVDTVDYSLRTDPVVVTMDGVTADDGKAMEGDNVKADVENVLGGEGDDDITGNALANGLDGGDGDDTLNGAGGNDTLFGGADDDTLDGGAGDDVLDGGAGDNALTCGDGDDIAYNEGAMGTRAADCEI